ncbi:MAG: hypothetical protein U1A78_03835 [Polyangia bacterium]
MKRLHECVVCGDPLSPGGRIDRRYCRESCRILAYRQRRRAQGSIRAHAPASAGHRAQAMPAWAARLADEQRHHQATQAALVDAKARITELDAALRKAKSAPAAPPAHDRPREAALQTRLAELEDLAREHSQQIARLQADLQAAHKRAREEEHAKESLQRQLDAQADELRAYKAAAKDRHTAAKPPNAATTEAKQPTAKPASNPQSRDLHPWEISCRESGYAVVPKWTLVHHPAQEERLHRLAEHLFSYLPGELAEQKSQRAGTRMRQFFNAAPSLLRDLSYAFVDRIAYSEPRTGKTKQQNRAHLNAALTDAQAALEQRDAVEARELDQFLEENRAPFQEFIWRLYYDAATVKLTRPRP